MQMEITRASIEHIKSNPMPVNQQKAQMLAACLVLFITIHSPEVTEFLATKGSGIVLNHDHVIG